MKTKLPLFAVLLIATLATLFAQGPLTPPGAPAPTMKTLAQIEARTPISSAPFTISQSGSYYLTANVTVSSGTAITITASNVTLDLNGFTISSTDASTTGYGILLDNGPRNITITNGFIQGSVTNNGGFYSGSGFLYGISTSGGVPTNVLVSRVSISGCQSFGIVLFTGDSTVVEFCTVRTVGGDGINASIIKSCSAVDCGSNAIFGRQVSDCLGQSSNFGNGVFARAAMNCQGQSVSGPGVSARVAMNCQGESVSGVGLFAQVATNCVGISNSGSGLWASKIATSCFGETSSAGTVGLFSDAAANYCSGSNQGGGPAMQADNAIGCTTFNGAIIAGQKFLGTP